MGISNLIKNEREKQGMSCYELAKKADVSARAISYWEQERRGISVECADKVLKALGVTYTIGAE